MGILIRIKAAALFGCLLLFTSQAFAEAYYWTNGNGYQYTNPGDACSKNMGTYNGWPLEYDRFNMDAPYAGTCMYKWSPDNYPYYGSSVNRRGDSCPPNTGPFNDSTGMCSPPPEPPKQPGEKCDNQSGGTSSNPMIWDGTSNKCEKFLDAKGDAPCQYIKGIGNGTTAYTISGNIGVGGNAVAPPTFTDAGLSCTVQTISTSECTINVLGSVSCNVEGRLTGTASSTGTTDAADALCEGGKCPVKEPKTETKEEACVPVGTGGGGTTCTQKKETAAEGTQQCGSVNGAYTCFTKKPSSNGITTTITASSQTLPDGSVKVTTVKDSSNTVCSDVKSCITKTSTTTSHSTSSPSGGTKNDTSCTGSCTPTGGGLETNPAAGTGTGTGTGTGGGNGTCTGSDCGEGGEGTASTSDDCLAPPACDGDPFLCAILKQDHIDTCKLMAPPTAAEMGDINAKIASERAKVDANQASMDSQVNTLLSGFQSSTGGSGTGGGKCLPDVPFSVMGHGMQIEFSKACDSISFVRMAILAMAYLFAARIVFREV